MAKYQEEQLQHKSLSEELAGAPDELISLLINDSQEKEWVPHAVMNEGKAYKQVYSALLLKIMYR